jgi:hypothetical protein
MTNDQLFMFSVEEFKFEEVLLELEAPSTNFAEFEFEPINTTVYLGPGSS